MRAKTVGFARSRALGPISILRMSSSWLRRIERRSARLICWRCVTCWTRSQGAKAPTMCKVYYAAYVKGITPIHHPCAINCRDYAPHKPSCRVDFAVDTQYVEAYLHLRAIRAAHGEGKKAGSEKRGARARRRAQSQPRSRPRCLVRRQSI